MQPLRAAICTGGSWLLPGHGGKGGPRNKCREQQHPEVPRAPGGFYGLGGGAGNLLWRTRRSPKSCWPRDVCPWRAQVASPTLLRASPALSAPPEPAQHPTGAFQQARSPCWLPAQAAIPGDPAGGSLRPPLTSLCQHFVLQPWRLFS